MRKEETQSPVSSSYRRSWMGKMAGRWSQNTSFDFKMDQSLASYWYERFAPQLANRQGTTTMWAETLNPATGLEPDSSFLLPFSHLHGAGSLRLVGQCDE
ncbi:hypothetical protein PCANC_08323 [Puccinia coronata f. sp. avenae]|uniref:Uncharacterized protein n=1 Tax=Puccinia coronata f. sp. avenae TaxID=200324 RepID=A0A2N5T4L7_9BASI|nr:hypothetical protein PCANC_08323 [Puccinia coronata f. sp. avenae]